MTRKWADVRAGFRSACLVKAAVRLAALSIAIVATTNAEAATQVGNIVFAKGAISAQDETGNPRLLGRKSPVYQKDTITTAAKSFAVIRFADQTKMSIRPNSELIIDQFNATEGKEKVEFNLVKGGLRAITGAIGKKKPESVRFKTRAASIGIRGTDLAMVICEKNECQLRELALSEFEPVKTKCLDHVEGLPPGTVIAVLDGAIFSEHEASGKRFDLDAMAAVYANKKEMTCMSTVPRLLLHDEYLNQIELDAREFELFDVLGTFDDSPACEIL